jgi:type I restriction enzyme, S subunit
MGGDYSLERLGKFASVQGGFAFKSRDFTDAGVPVLKIKNVRHREVDTSEVDYVTEEVAKDTSRFLCRTGDILISMTGSGPQAPNSIVGRVARFTGPSDKYLINQRVGRLVIKEPSKLDKRFLFYVLTQKEIQWRLVSIATGSANQVNISSVQVEDLQIPLPPLPEQQAIAETLGGMDNKIELNRRINQTLEAMAQAIFKSWFVDFDPVRVKVVGQYPPGLAPHIADLFPDAFEDSNLGEIPSGWQIIGLNETGSFLNGLALQKYPPKDGQSLPVIKIAQLRKGNTEGADKASSDLEPAYIVDDGDVLFSWSGSLECTLWTGGRGALNQHLFKVTSDRFPKWFYYLWIHKHLPWFRLVAAGKATTMGHIQRHHLAEAKILVPSVPLLRMMDRIIAPLIDAFVLRSLECRMLAELHDVLLPKLISGELPISDAERIVGRCI